MTAWIPSFRIAGTEVRDKCFLSVYKRVPPCLLIMLVSQKTSSSFFMHDWNHRQDEKSMEIRTLS